MITENDIKRFNSKYDVGNPNECWEWKAGCGRSGGYGTFWLNRKGHNAGRVSYCITHNVDIDSLTRFDHVCHTCDNPPCVNPNHLFMGDPKINARDRNNKGRQGVIYSIHNKNIFKTHCIHGHKFDLVNTGIRTNGNRYCIACKNRRSRERKLRLEKLNV